MNARQTSGEPLPVDPSSETAECYVPPTLEVISLDCEISSYAPDGDDTPLF